MSDVCERLKAAKEVLQTYVPDYVSLQHDIESAIAEIERLRSPFGDTTLTGKSNKMYARLPKPPQEPK